MDRGRFAVDLEMPGLLPWADRGLNRLRCMPADVPLSTETWTAVHGTQQNRRSGADLARVHEEFVQDPVLTETSPLPMRARATLQALAIEGDLSDEGHAASVVDEVRKIEP